MSDPESLLAHAGFVRAVARAAVRGDDEVDDVVQETWLSALQGRPKGSVRGWLASIVRRRAADLARLRGAQRRRDRAAAKEEAVTAEDVVERAEVGRGLVGDVLALEEPYRTALLLRYHEGLAPREIAARLGLPVETVRTHVKRGLERLRERLDARHGERRAWMLALAPWIGPPPSPTAPPPHAVPLAAATKVALAVAVLAVVVAVPLWILRADSRPRGFTAPSVLDFGRVPFGEERVLPVVVRNDTSRDVLVKDVHVNCGCFRVDPGFSHVVAAGSEVSLSVHLSTRAVSIGPLRTKRLTIHSDDPQSPRIEVALRGEVVPAPTLEGRADR